MIGTIFLSREEFAAKRRKDQDDAVAALLADVQESIEQGEVTSDLLEGMRDVYADAVEAEGADRPTDLPGAVGQKVQGLLGHTNPASDVQATALAIASLLLNEATIAAAIADEDDVFLEWVTMHDGAVREAHRETDGQVRPVGEKFDVDGTEMVMPGDVTAPIELWINCRCTLRPTFLADGEFHVRETAKSSATAGILFIPETMPHTGTWTSATTSTGVITMTSKTEEKPVEDDLAPFEDMDEEQVAALASLVPWHGVLAPEGVASGDGRTFGPESLSNRELPLPLTYQKSSAAGHDGSVVVGSIETIERVDGLMLATGYFLSTDEADEVVGLIAHFGKYGVSVDADDAEFDYEEESGSVTFTKARICSASLVSIPAFAEAYVALGPWEEDEALVASGEVFVKTEDGPGWLTHPVDTDRLRDYWVRGPGAAKIGWGTPGDFNRCRVAVAKYVKPQYLAGYCANRHYDALGFWPGRPVAGDTETFQPAEGEQQAPALSLVASSAKQIEAPAAWFKNPKLAGPTHFTVTKEGRVFGHVAEWGVCHVGIAGVCTEAPKSKSGYGYFANKAVLLDNGEMARTGVISIAGKHAPGRMGLVAATQHYDDTTKALCDVSIGEDEHGIWVAGWVRPGTDPQDVVALRASDISGDWRRVSRWGGDPDEMVAVLAVNSGGFPVKVAADDSGMISLVAAGMIQAAPEPEDPEVDKLAEAFAKAMERVEQNKIKRQAAMAGLRKKFQGEDV